MAPFDRSYTTFYWSAIVTIALLYHFRVIWRSIIVNWKGHWRSFKLVPFESLGAVFYSPSIVTMAVSLTVYGGCSCVSGVMVEYRTRNREVAGSTHTRSTTSNLEQVANLLCAQANSAFPFQQVRKWVIATATGWRPSVADWGDGVSASCTVGPIVR